MKELVTVVEWKRLGIHLKIQKHELDKIETQRCHHIERCKEEMFDEWLKYGDASWNLIVDALLGISERALAMKIAKKYGKL